MTFSKLAIGTWPLNFFHRAGRKLLRRSKRKYPVSIFIVHHNAGTSNASLKAALWSIKRTLSCTYAMAQNGDIYGVVTEEQKPNTSASIADHRAITIEIVNETGEPEWRISERAFDQLARLIADCATRHNFPINRDHIIGHREVKHRFGDGYATACPGPWLYARMDELCERAREYQKASQGSTPAPSKPAPEPAPKPVVPAKDKKPSEPWRTPINRTMVLATRWGKYRNRTDAQRLRRQWGWFPAGSYKVTGQSGNAYKIVGKGYVGWIHGSARDGIR